MAKYIFQYTLEGNPAVFEFDLPLRPHNDPRHHPPPPNPDGDPYYDINDGSPEVEIIKLYLGVDQQPGESNALFDPGLHAALRAWQTENIEDIMAEMPDEEIPEGEARFFANQFREQGEVGELTFKAMMKKGLALAAKQYLESEHWISISVNADKKGNPLFDFPNRKDEIQQPPFIDRDFIYYNYVTEYTNAMGHYFENLDVLRDTFQQAVIDVFDFYGKPREWVVSGEDRPDLLEGVTGGLYKTPGSLRESYTPILKALDRIGDQFYQEQEFTFSIRQRSMDEYLNLVDCDILAGQSLEEDPSKTYFASIVELQWPSPRPNSKHILKIKVRRSMFEAIVGGNVGMRTGGTFDVTDPDTLREFRDTYRSGKKKATDLWVKAKKSTRVLKNPSRMNKQIDKAAKGARRKLVKKRNEMAKNAWRQAKSGQGGLSDEERQKRAQKTLEETEQQRRQGSATSGGPKEFIINQLQDKIEKVSAGIEEYNADIEKFRRENTRQGNTTSRFENITKPIIPDINPVEEARKLREIYAALGEFMDINGWKIDHGPADKSFLKITFAPVKGDIYGIQPESDTSLNPNLDNVEQPGQTSYNGIIGHQITDVIYMKDGTKEIILKAGKDLFNPESNFGKSPFINPTTMSYLMSLVDVEEDLREDPCDDLAEGEPALAFFSRWHFPMPSFNFSKRSSSGINIDASVTIESNTHGEPSVTTVKDIPGLVDTAVATAVQDFREQQVLLSKNIDALMESTIFKKRGRVIDTGDVYPDFGKIPCDIEGMWKEFIDSWRMDQLLCQYKKCIPSLPDINLSLDFKIPALPDIPTFDPMHFVLPQLRISINDMILGFICKFIKQLLESLRKPDCEDLLQFGVAAYSKLQDMKKRQEALEDAQERADAAADVIETLNSMGVMDADIDSDVGNVLEAVSLALTPSEFCDLLQGKATSEVLGIVLSTIQNFAGTLKEYLKTVDQVEKFFRVLGTVVDPFICDRIRELSDIVISQQLCIETDADLRSMLQNQGATEEQIKAEMKSLELKRKALIELSKKGDFSALMSITEKGLSPEEMEKTGLPGPNNNPFQEKMLKISLGAVLTNLKQYFQLEIGALPEKLIDETAHLIGPGDEGFNQFDYIRFMFYKKQIENLEESGTGTFERITTYRKPTFFDTMSLLKMGIPIEYIPEVKIFPQSTAVPGEELDLITDIIEKHVVGYIEKYTVFTRTVSQKLKEILNEDITTIVRKFPSTKNGHREFHIRLLTEKMDQVPFDVSGQTKISVGTSIGMTDLPFSMRSNPDAHLSASIKDCYRFTYEVPGSNNIITKTYKEQLPQPWMEMRATDLDITSNLDRAKLLRPGGFSSFIISKYLDLSDANPGDNTFSVYSETNEANLIPKLMGFLEPVDLESIRGAFDSVMETPIDDDTHPLARLIVGLIVGALAAGSEFTDMSKDLPVYSSVVDSFNFQLSRYITNSKFFDVEEFLTTSSELTQEYIPDGDCYRKNDKVFKFEKFVDKFVDKFNEKAALPKHEPTARDFNENGPYEEAMIEGLFKIYIEIYCLETMFKAIFMMSEAGAKDLFNTQLIVDYITDSVVGEMSSTLFGGGLKKKFNKIVTNLTGQENPRTAVRTLVIRNLDVSAVADYVNDVFEPKYSSFKERIYNEMAENVKNIPSVMDYPKITVLNDPGRRSLQDLVSQTDESFENYDEQQVGFISQNYNSYTDVSVSAKLPNLYDKFAFDGWSEELIQKKINSGHFWVEKFYRISDFETFKHKYNDIYDTVALFPEIGRVFKISDKYKEYISAEDLESMLFGYEETDSLEEYEALVEQNLKTQAEEYRFIKYSLLALLGDYFQLGPAKAAKECLAYSLMVELGMSHIFDHEERQNQYEMRDESEPVVRTSIYNEPHYINSVRQRYANGLRGPRLTTDLGLILPPTPSPYLDTSIEVDLGFRMGNVTAQELYSRMTKIWDDGEKTNNDNANDDYSKTWEDNIPEVSKPFPAFGKKRSSYLFVNLFSDYDLSLERKSQLFVDCLMKFPELVHNWPVNNQGEGWGARIWKPLWRDPSIQERSGYSSQKYAVLNALSNVQPSLGAWIPTLTTFGRQSQTSRIESFWNNTGPRNTVDYRDADQNQNLVLDWYISEIFSSTPVVSYQKSRSGIFNIANSYSRSRLASVISERNRRQDERQIISSSGLTEETEDLIVSDQTKLYKHLIDNLHVGYRLMFGHSVDRSETKYGGEMRAVLDPREIFQEFTLNQEGDIGLPSDEFIFNKKRCFLGHVENNPVSLSRGLGAATSLNPDSVFYSKAIQVSQRYQRSLISSDSVERPRTIPSSDPEEIYEDLITDEIRTKMVYSIPLDEYTVPVSNFCELFENFEQEQKTPLTKIIERNQQEIDTVQEADDEELLRIFRQQLREIEDDISRSELLLEAHRRIGDTSRANATIGKIVDDRLKADSVRNLIEGIESGANIDTDETRGIVADLQQQIDDAQSEINFEGFFDPNEDPFDESAVSSIRRKFIRNEIFSNYEDDLLMGVLSLSPKNNGKRVVNPIAPASKPHRIVFDFLFPIDRYASLHFLQNIEIFDKERGEQGMGMFTATKLFILQTMLVHDGITTSPPLAPGEVDNIPAVLRDNVGGDLPKKDSFMELIAKAIASAAMDAAAAAMRGLANVADPAYRDMRSGYKKDPCAMKSGLTRSLVSNKEIDEFDGNLENGFGKRQGCKQYVTLNQFPADLVSSIVDLDGDQLKKTVMHFSGVLTNDKKRYGYLLTPLGQYALSVRQNKGERHSKLKERYSCPPTCATEEITEEPKGECED